MFYYFINWCLYSMFCAYNSLGTPSTVTSTFVILGLKNSSVSRVNLVALLSFVKMSHTPLKLFDGLLMSMEKLVSESLSGMMRALRILSYKILLFIYSVRI